MIWRTCMKNLASASALVSVGDSRLPKWGPKDEDCSWLEALTDRVQNQRQWRECCVARP